MDVITHKFKKFSKIVKNICAEAQIPLYNSRFSNKIFSNVQHLFLYVAKENCNFTYRRFSELLYDSKLPQYIGLRRIPHFTTLQKFVSRIKSKVFDRIIFETRSLFRQIGTIWGVDSTGFELDQASAHYCKRIDRQEPVKGFVNLNAISDLYNKIFVVVKLRKYRRHDCIDLKCMYPKIKNEPFDYFVADKGYDAEYNHKLVFESGKHSLISLKYMDLPSCRTRGQYRKKAKREFEDGIFGQRSLTESNFSALKRRFGSKLKARTYQTQKIELLAKIFNFNMERAIKTMILMLRRMLWIST